jgi:hypothetical protein
MSTSQLADVIIVTELSRSNPHRHRTIARKGNMRSATILHFPSPSGMMYLPDTRRHGDGIQSNPHAIPNKWKQWKEKWFNSSDHLVVEARKFGTAIGERRKKVLLGLYDNLDRENHGHGARKPRYKDHRG